MIIPSYPDSRNIELTDKPMMDSLFHRAQPRISEFTFANLFLFRHAHSYRISRIDEALIILGKGYDGREYFLPPVSGDVDGVIEQLFADGRILYGADELFIAEYVSGKGYLEFTEDRDNFDYLYFRQDLSDLPGNLYHKKKNRINYFTVRHSYVIESFSQSITDEAYKFLLEWHNVKSGIESHSLAPEMEATAEGLELAGQLGLEGLVVFVDGVLKAFALGEKLNESTSVCHFEKADPFIDGLYQLVDREFNRRCFTDCTHVNREQDLGHPGLRSSKLSYHPVELIKKYHVRKK